MISTQDLRTVESAEAFVHLLHARRDVQRSTGNTFEFSQGAPSAMGILLERASLLRGRRKDGSTPGRQHSIGSEIPVHDDARTWHRALNTREVRDPILELAEALWSSLRHEQRTLLNWSAGYNDEEGGDEAGTYAEMASHANSRGWARHSGGLITVSWVKDHLHAARQAVLRHHHFIELLDLLQRE